MIMKESSEKKKQEVKKYGFYACLKDLDKCLGLLVFHIDSDVVEGVKFAPSSVSKFSVTKTYFETLLIYDLIEFVEILPRTAWKEYKAVYNK